MAEDRAKAEQRRREELAWKLARAKAAKKREGTLAEVRREQRRR